jgi:hypothetical protein
VQNREKCHLHALSVLARTIKKMTVFYLEMINDDFNCARGGFPPVAGHRLVACVEISLSRLSPLPAPPAISALIRQHRGRRGESGNGTIPYAGRAASIQTEIQDAKQKTQQWNVLSLLNKKIMMPAETVA